MEERKVQLVIVRHGESTANRARVLQGQSDFPLNDTGRRQARSAGSRLSREAFDAAYASDLSRAAETATIVLGAARLGDGAELRMEPMLRERRFGNLEKKPISSFLEESEARYRSQGVKESWMYTPEGGETLPDLEKRAEDFFQTLCSDLRHLIRKRTKDDHPLKVLIVSHGGFIKEVLIHLASRNCAFPRKDYRGISPNTGITKIDMTFSGDDLRLRQMSCDTLYDGDHLAEIGEVKLGGGF